MKAKIDKIFSILSAKKPEPKIELNYVNEYTLIIAIVLSAQSTDIGVNKATIALFRDITSPEDMVKLGESGLKEYIKTIGLYNSKAKHIIALSETIIKKHSSNIPHSLKDLVALPGVGIKSAKVFLNSLFHEPLIAVDTHVFRVAQRLGLSNASTREKTGEELEKIIPLKWQIHASHWLVLHGRYICKARKPMCEECPISGQCDYIGSSI